MAWFLEQVPELEASQDTRWDTLGQDAGEMRVTEGETLGMTA